MEIVIAIAKNSAGFIFGLFGQPLGRQFGYLTSYKSNVDKLKTEVQKLTADKSDKQRIVEDAKKRGEDIAAAVQDWLDRVEATIAEANRLVNEENEGLGEVRCLNWPFPNLCLRRKLSKEAKEMAQKVSKIMAEGKFERYSFPAPPQMTAPPSTRGYEALKSRTSLLNEIKQALKDPNIYMIGVYGMGGVGKTTVVKELEWQAKKEGSFGAVVMATITNAPDLRRIQGELADGLGLEFRSEAVKGRAGELRGRISRKESILVILDDIWGELDVTELGVPYGDEHKGCKLVLTSRDRDVLSSKMDTQKDFSLEQLSEEESWNLFAKMVGDVVKHDSIRPVAVEVAKCCAGLPLSIVTVAKALRKKEDVRAWKDSLTRLDRFDHDQVHRSLKFSYDYLESKELKSLFLLIGSFEDGVDTEKLLPICWGLGLYEDVHTLAEARNRHYTLINDLRASSLLLEREIELVKMHDLVRRVAKLIATTTHPTYVVQRFTRINEWPRIDQLQKYHHIILPLCYISELPEKLECPELKLFLLENFIGDYLVVPNNFFSGMREVKVLHLHGMKFTRPPPPSLSLLANLRSLNLSGSDLEDIAIVGELTSLEILILEGAKNIVKLPKEIGHLTHLRMLNFSNCPMLRLIPKNLLSDLKCLEELYMANCHVLWGALRSNYATLGELGNIHQLTTLDLTIQDGSILPRDLHNFAKLERYKISIGMSFLGASKYSRTLMLKDSSSTCNFSNDGFKLLLTRAENLYLAALERDRNILPRMDGGGFMELRYLFIEDSTGLLHIINSEPHLHHAFPNLEILILHNLYNMEEICHGPLPTQSFDKLKVIKVSNCNKLKNLLLCSHVRHLSQLQEMTISKCQSMKEIVAEEIRGEIHEIENLVLPELHFLWLQSLPILSFYSVPSTVDNGLFPLALIDQKVVLPNLETLLISKLDNLKSLWCNQLAPNSFYKLNKMKISGCPKLLNVFPSSVLNHLMNVETLKVRECDELGVIFEIQELSTDATNQEVSATRLRKLTLSSLPKLKYIWSKDPHGVLRFQNLCKMRVFACGSLDHIFPISVAEELQQLKVLDIHGSGIENIVEKSDTGEIKRVYIEQLELGHCHRLKTIVPSSVAFHALDVLEVHGCDGVVNIMTSSAATSLSKLRVLRISECEMIEEIVASENDGDAPSEIAFMKLEELELSALPRIKCFCKGSYSFGFPSLQTVRVEDCPMMETFCNGNLTAPRLRLVASSFAEHEGRWDGDLNATIGNIFAERMQEQDLNLSSSESEGSDSLLT